MGLRKLSKKSASVGGPHPSDRADCEAAIRRLQTEADSAAASSRDEAPGAYSARVGTDLQTPPPAHREFMDLERDDAVASATPVAPPASSPSPARTGPVDAFTAALDALRSTLRHSAATAHAAPGPVTESRTSPASARVEAREISHAAPALDTVESESAFVLEKMPIPTSSDDFIQVSGGMYQESPALEKRKSRPEANPALRRYAGSIDSALQAVRNAVPGLNLTPPKSDTPTAGRKRPSSDGIPKSVSEDLPKYPARPRMRTCTRCGNETKLRDAKCQKCGHVDESLGILDAVISGDLARVEQVLLVRPHLIALRTSRHDWTLLHLAASGGNPKMVELLIEKGASVNSANRDGKTALHYAAGKGHAGIVQTLLAHLADPAALYNGKSALDLARKNGHREVEEVLRQHLPPE